MQLLIPSFLKDVKLTKEDVQNTSGFIKNWLRLLDTYKELDHIGIAKCIIVEMNYKQRKAVLDRLMGRYTKLMKQKHIEELEDLIGGPFRTGNTSPVNAYINQIIEEGLHENQSA